ncbi:hypothetical protein DFP72DRAFT_420279 [Ephemerocybe angulata]|uniref:Uncharacterized protein n=1 Tax=Ephemerocybe angulata TaxID=980116 RepID=A0A8H6IH73_9AGAR|nr:hypothetical protein DFP72DRAFT_420279 [Tulosesus angulatus]
MWDGSLHALPIPVVRSLSTNGCLLIVAGLARCVSGTVLESAQASSKSGHPYKSRLLICRGHPLVHRRTAALLPGLG